MFLVTHHDNALRQQEQREGIDSTLERAVDYYRAVWPGPTPVPELWLPSDVTDPDHVAPRVPARVVVDHANLTVHAGEIAPGDPFHQAMHGDHPHWAPKERA